MCIYLRSLRVVSLHVTDILTFAEFSKEEMVSSLGIMWIPARGGNIPARAVLGGRDESGGPIYIGRARFSSDLLPAKVVPNYRTAYVSFAGKEYRIANYEVKAATAFHWNAALFRIRKVPGLCLSGNYSERFIIVFPSTYRHISGLVS